MKNTIKIIGNLNRDRRSKVPLLIIALVAVIGFTMVACGKSGGGGKLNGTYVNEEFHTSYTFSGNKATLEIAGEKWEFDYEIKNGKLCANSKEFGTTEDEYSLQGNTLTIRGVAYTKK